MKNINEWLDENVNNDVNLDDETAIEKQADIVRAEAEAAGYSADELKNACGGDIGDYLRNRRAESGDVKLAGDLSPILTPGFNQQ